MSDLDAGAILAAVGRDKKAVAGRVPSCCPPRVGAVAIVPDVTAAEIRAALRVMAGGEALTAR